MLGERCGYSSKLGYLPSYELLTQLNFSNKFGDHTVGGMGNFSPNNMPRVADSLIIVKTGYSIGTYDFTSRYMLEYNELHTMVLKYLPKKTVLLFFFQVLLDGWFP